MELKSIRAFVMTAKYLNFSKVAEVLFLSQSSVSKYISSLEGEMGKKLLIRDTKSVMLTEFGEAFLPYAINILDAENAAMEFLHCYKGGLPEISFKLGVARELVPSPPETMLPLVVSAINDLHLERNIKVKMRFYHSTEIRERLVDHRLDAGLLPINSRQVGKLTYGNIKAIQIRKSPNYLLYPPHHGTEVPLEELVPKIDVMICAHDPVPQSITMQFIHELKIDPTILPCGNWSEMFVQILEGAGCGLIPDTLLSLAGQCGLPVISLEHLGLESSLCFIYPPPGNWRM